MNRWLAVALGGALGSVARYGIGVMAARFLGAAFPWGTLAVNLAGCLAIGAGAAIAESRGASEATRLFLFAGVLGGFTTFSAFGLETARLFGDGQSARAAANVAANLLGGLIAVWAGTAFGRRL